jgi:Uri superfamily endonuclease
MSAAMGHDRSAVSLARRLVRHASRLGQHEPHPIREMMLAEFHRIGLASNTFEPANLKKPKWNIDYVLDQMCVELIEAFVIRIPARAEASIGKYLEMDSLTVVIELGLGANDINGNTHRLRANADDQWWRSNIERVGSSPISRAFPPPDGVFCCLSLPSARVNDASRGRIDPSGRSA